MRAICGLRSGFSLSSFSAPSESMRGFIWNSEGICLGGKACSLTTTSVPVSGCFRAAFVSFTLATVALPTLYRSATASSPVKSACRLPLLSSILPTATCSRPTRW